MNLIVFATILSVMTGVYSMIKYRDGKMFFVPIGIAAIGLLFGYAAEKVYDDYKTKSKYTISRSDSKITSDASTSNTITWSEAETLINSLAEEIGTEASKTTMVSYITKKTKEIDFARITKSNPRDQPDYLDSS